MAPIQFILAFVALAVASTVSLTAHSLAPAQSPNAYYGEEFHNSPHLTGESLQRLLHKIITSKHQRVDGHPDKIVSDCEKGSLCYRHNSLGYNEAKSFLLSKYYLIPNGQGFVIRDVYCENNYPVPGPKAVPDSSVLNIEHTWPQSLFTTRHDKNTQKSDMHHLYPSDSELNSIRGNYPFGEVHREQKPLKCQSSKFGIAKNANQMVFEPPKDHRGNVARALFYFSIRYETRIDDRQEAFLREWHKSDPIDSEEMTRNEEIFKIQGNRNPFVDMPYLVDQIQNF